MRQDQPPRDSGDTTGVGNAPPWSAPSTLRRELWVFSRSRYLIASCLGLCLLVTAVYNYGSRPLYQSVSIVSLEEAGVSALRVRAVEDQVRKVAAVTEQVRILKSPEMALLAVSGADPVIVADLAVGPLGEWVDRLKEEARYHLGISSPYGSSTPALVEVFRTRLSVEAEPRTTWAKVSYTGYDPQAAAMAVNRLVEVYMAETEKQTEASSGTARQQIEDRVTKRQELVTEAIGKLEKFEDAEGLQNVDARRQQLTTEVSRLQGSLIEARQSRLNKKALFEETQRLSWDAMLSLPSVRADPDISADVNQIADLEASLARSSASLGNLHPDMVALRSDLELARRRLVGRLNAAKEATARDYRMAVREENDIAAAMNGAQANLARLDRSSLQHSFIQKEAEAGQSAVGALIEEKVRETDREVFFAPVVIEKAAPVGEPISPQRARNFQYAFGFGLLLGLSLAWLRSHLDETIKTPEDVKANIGLPLLGMVPRGESRQLNLFDADDGAMTRMFEAYRMLRTNVAGGDVSSKDSRVILLTSSREAEGKTTTTCGLGITLARAGRRVLLIDGDLRRASLSRALSAGDRPGLIEMTGGTPIKMCITRTSVAGLSLLPSGRARQNLDEVLNRESLGAAIDSVRSDFDWILCDAPPILAVADAAILCRLADAVVLVIGANATPIGSIHATLDQLNATGANVQGVVLNNVDFDRDSHYYRHYYSAYYSDYSKGARSRLPIGKAVPSTSERTRT